MKRRGPLVFLVLIWIIWIFWRRAIRPLHACRKYSGRVGRSAAAKELNPEVIKLAVIAHIRHERTNYDELMGSGAERADAREAVWGTVDGILCEWKARKET